MELERMQKEAGIISLPKRPRLQGMDVVPVNLPHISATDFEFLRYVCPILQIFDTETLKVIFFKKFKYLIFMFSFLKKNLLLPPLFQHSNELEIF